MRVLTVRQPWAWAWAIIHGGKDAENRVRNIAGSYQGPVAIHAGLGWDDHAYDARENRLVLAPERDVRGAIIGVVDLFDAHPPVFDELDRGDMCSPWALPDAWHLVLANPRPIPYRGALGLRTLDTETSIAVWEAIS